MGSRQIEKALWAIGAVPGPSRLRHTGLRPALITITHPYCIYRDRRSISTTYPTCSGHNRWSKIKHKKGAADAQRSALFSRLTTDLYLALRPPNSPDPLVNQRLALAVGKAREGGVTRSAIDAIFARAKSAVEGTGQSLTYEAMGPGGKEAFIIECLTDNTSRTFSRVKALLNKNQSRIAPVSFMFDKKGLIVVDPASSEAEASYDGLFELAVEGGAEDVREVEGEEGVEWEIYTPPSELSTLTNLLMSPEHASTYTVRSSELAYIPLDPLSGDEVNEEKAESIMRVVELLEGEADVVKVWTNLADD